MILSDLDRNASAIIATLEQLSDLDQIRLMEMGFLPGKTIKKLNSAILNGPISFEIEGTILALTKKDTDQIEITPTT